MTIAKRIGWLTLVAVVLAFVLGDMGCGEDLDLVLPGVASFVEVTVKVTKDGDGTGRVTSSDIETGGGVFALDCGPLEFDDPDEECIIGFDDATGSGTLFLTATPDPGSDHSGWGGSCTPSADCDISPVNGTVALEFDSDSDVEFNVTVTFDLAVATVAFVYLAATSIDPAVQNMFPGCVAGVGSTHIHPSWREFDRIDMTPVGADRWEISFNDVPTDEDVRIRISDPNVCADNPTGAATENASANGVLLTQIVDTPGAGIEPGLGFRVAPDGTVTP